MCLPNPKDHEICDCSCHRTGGIHCFPCCFICPSCGKNRLARHAFDAHMAGHQRELMEKEWAALAAAEREAKADRLLADQDARLEIHNRLGGQKPEVDRLVDFLTADEAKRQALKHGFTLAELLK